MTRVNLVPVEFLANQHLLAEWREIPRIIPLAEKYYLAGKPCSKIPKTFRMGTGHVMFFYNKLDWIVDRHSLVTAELEKRCYKLSTYEQLNIDHISVVLKSSNWKHTKEDEKISAERIYSRLLEKPKFYKHPLGIDKVLCYYKDTYGL